MREAVGCRYTSRVKSSITHVLQSKERIFRWRVLVGQPDIWSASGHLPLRYLRIDSLSGFGSPGVCLLGRSVSFPSHVSNPILARRILSSRLIRTVVHNVHQVWGIRFIQGVFEASVFSGFHVSYLSTLSAGAYSCESSSTDRGTNRLS